MSLFGAPVVGLLFLFLATFNVPEDFEQIQDAIEVSSDGDSVLVGPGEYTSIDFLGKNIAVVSSHGPGCTTIVPLAEGEWGNVVFLNGEGSEASLSGFSVVGEDGVASRGICIYGASPTVSGNWITDHKFVIDGCGMYVGNSSSIIENNLIMNNHCGYGPYSVFGGGIAVTASCSLSIRNNVIAGNSAVFGGGIATDYLSNGVFLHLENNTVADNSSTSLYLDYADNITIKNCIIWGSEYSGIGLGQGTILNIAWSDIEDGQDGIYGGIVTWGDGMIDDPPVFVTGAICDYELDEDMSPSVDSGDPSYEFNDPEDPLYPGFALYPALGLLRNDMGAFGGGGSESWTGIETSPGVPGPILRLSQNPCRGVLGFRVDLVLSERGIVTVVDLSGRVVFSRNVEAAHGNELISLDLSGLPTGIYTAVLTSSSGEAVSRFILFN